MIACCVRTVDGHVCRGAVFSDGERLGCLTCGETILDIPTLWTGVTDSLLWYLRDHPSVLAPSNRGRPFGSGRLRTAMLAAVADGGGH